MKHFVALAAALSLVVFAGSWRATCEAAEMVPDDAAVPEAAPPEAPAAEPAAEAEPPEASAAGSDAAFFAELGYKDVASAADTARALVILTSEGRRSGGDFEADREFLADRGVTTRWLRRSRPTRPTTKGQLAALVCRALDIKGGLWMRLLGPVPRAALHECVYLDLMVGGAEYTHVKGGELVGIIDRADRFRLRQAGREPPKLEENLAEEVGG